VPALSRKRSWTVGHVTKGRLDSVPGATPFLGPRCPLSPGSWPGPCVSKRTCHLRGPVPPRACGPCGRVPSGSPRPALRLLLAAGLRGPWLPQGGDKVSDAAPAKLELFFVFFQVIFFVKMKGYFLSTAFLFVLRTFGKVRFILCPPPCKL